MIMIESTNPDPHSWLMSFLDKPKKKFKVLKIKWYETDKKKPVNRSQ